MIKLEVTKYHKWYNAIIRNRLSNPPKGYTELHHIIPKCLGGSNDELNLVRLKAREHYICHMLLVRMFADDVAKLLKLLKAYLMMSNCRDIKVNSRIYEKFRERYSKECSISFKGKGNNQFGTKWIYNPVLRLNKKILLSDNLPEGWCLGRILNWKKHENRNARKQDILTISSTDRICKQCNAIFRSKNERKEFCTSKCGRKFQYVYSNPITITRNSKIKQIKMQNYPAYKCLGWTRI